MSGVQRRLTANRVILHMGMTQFVIFGTAKTVEYRRQSINVSIIGQLTMRKVVVKYWRIFYIYYLRLYSHLLCRDHVSFLLEKG